MCRKPPGRLRIGATGLGALLLLCTLPGCQAVRRTLPGVRHEPRTYALLLNGGGKKEVNYNSHLNHVRGVVSLLEAGGVPGDRIVIFSSDGMDPAPDLATRAANEEDWFWLLPPGVARFLRPQVTYVSSSVDGFELHPATREALRTWFQEQGRDLRPGDTLLFYVTDHGRKNPKDLTNNTISLWKESLNVAELRDLFAELDPGVDVVMLMSQCFSGSFAYTIFPDGPGSLPSGRICGYFASTADRPAYGCYPENRGKDRVGHSFDFIEAAEALGSFPEAERRVLVTDDTPDVPHTTTDFYLSQLLDRAAKASDRPVTKVTDEMIARAWENKGRWEPQIRLLDRIGQTFGIFSPRSLAELDRQAKLMPEVSARLGTYEGRWRDALNSLALENLQRFVEENPAWKERLEAKALQALDEKGRTETTGELLAELVPFTKRNRARYERLELLHRRMEDARAARYRMEVRLGVVLRMRAILNDVAGRVYLEEFGTPAERESFAELEACESIRLGKPAPGLTAAALEAPPSFPPLAEDHEVVETVMPAWMGIRYRPLTEAESKKEGVAVGAARVMTVFPESPASAAGMEVGDLVLGPPGARFNEPNQIREWTMRREIGEPAPLDILRDKTLRRITLRPGPFPLAMPELPGPPKLGSAAPPVDVDLFRGAKKLATGRERLLFFWATWCLPCKSSLPELLAFGRAKNVEIVAITDEPAEKLEEFFAKFEEPFPEIVAIDRYRATFQNYGVSGTPTFVLVGPDGTVRHYQTGYNAKVGLGIGDWHWDGAGKKVSRGGD